MSIRTVLVIALIVWGFAGIGSLILAVILLMETL